MTGATSAAPCSSASVSSGSFTPASVSAPPRPPRAAPTRPAPTASPAPSATPARSTSEATSPAGDSPPDGDPDLSRRRIERLARIEDRIEAALEKRGGTGRVFLLDKSGLATPCGRVTPNRTGRAVSKAFTLAESNPTAEILVRFDDGGPAIFPESPPEKAEPLAGEARGEAQVQAGGPFTLDNTTKTRTAQGIYPDREAAERAINLLIRKGFAPRLSAYPTGGRGPIFNALVPTAENLDIALRANLAGSSVGILIHGVRADLEPGKAPRAGDLEPRALMLDLDGTQADGSPWTAEAILERLPMRPALVVETSPHRFHVLAGPLGGLTLESFRRGGQALAARFAGADPVREATKTIKLPGSLNMKNPENPFLVKVVFDGGARR